MRIVIKSDIQRQQAIKEVSQTPAGHVVTIAEDKVSRSEAQRRLMWKWEGVIGDELGEIKEDVHRRHKDTILKPIMEKNFDRHPHFAGMMDSIRGLYNMGMHGEAINLNNQITDLISTNEMDVHEMTEYLNEVQRIAQGLNINLPQPDDYYRLAMGRAA